MKKCSKCSQHFNDKALVCSRCGGTLEQLPQAEPLPWGYSSEHTAAARPFLLSSPNIEPIRSDRSVARENVVIRPQRRAPSHRRRRAAVRTAPYSPDGRAADQNVYDTAEAPIYGTAAAQEYTAQRQTGNDRSERRTIFGDEPIDTPEERRGGLFGGREQGGTHTQPGIGAGHIFQNIELALRYIIPGAAILAAIVMIIVNWQNIWGVIANFMIFWIPSFFLSLWVFRRNFGMRAGTLVVITTLLAAIFTVLYYNIAGIGSGILSLITPLLPLIIIAGALFFLLRR